MPQQELTEGRDVATFNTRVATFQARERERDEAATPEGRAQATLAWLQALKQVLAAVPLERTDEKVFGEWLDAHEALVVYSEPAGEWLISNDLLRQLHEQHRGAPVADEIAWLAAVNGLPGECEGYIPCYVFVLNHLDGEYLRQHPNGRHRAEALRGIAESLTIAVDDLLKRPDAGSYLSIPQDCPDLRASLDPLRRAVTIGPDDLAGLPLELIDRLAVHCQGK
jgi:hypothetical protein